MTANETMSASFAPRKIALVFGISGDQGQFVAAGLLATGAYNRVYGATRDVTEAHIEGIAKHMLVPVKADAGSVGNDGVADHVTIIDVDLNSTASVRQACLQTHATDIFLVRIVQNT